MKTHEENDQVIVALPENFPLSDFEDIALRLKQSKALIPGYIPGDMGFLNIYSIIYEQKNTKDTIS